MMDHVIAGRFNLGMKIGSGSSADIYIAGVPRLKWFGVEGNYPVFAIDLLGPSLEDLFNYCNRKFTLNTVLMLADQLVYIIGFGLSKNFRDLQTHEHIPYRENRGFAGTHQYASVNTHLGIGD
ncbi:hypothetical protein TSUD_337730 [Trifolium subterraneum]|uniref:Non-specific serine/threonine protein kinase n=1 Tax=Trifolium subterraneum TaxID=3900 RepID=A0A2Z6LPB7_TRISU|nr:hypothetical protein TSUD_337730 [Trifolium subterraneum]